MIAEIKSAGNDRLKQKLKTKYGINVTNNPLMELESFDNGRSLAFERLHNIELGIVKIFTHLTFEMIGATDKVEIEHKLKAFDWTAFKRTLSPSFVYKHQSYVGRDFKLWAQVAPFILASNVPPGHLQLWHLISEVFVFVHQSNIESDELRTLQMKGLINT
ncbi:uncharacterized protein [Ptychodera flava]|uniref:uncharacterized protein n=1 Tax=Ptychodera flava TaxID=63121 RepID=UPI003969EC7E